MPDVLEELQVVISTELSQFREGMNEVRRVIEGIRPTIGALGLALTSLIAVGFQDVVESANALSDVNRVLQGLGYDVDDVGGRIQQMAESFGETTKFDEADSLRAYKTLLSITRDIGLAEQLWGVALDVAADKGVDVETAAAAVARYVTEGGGQLVKWYPFLKDAATQQERLKAISGDLVPVIGGAAEAVKNLGNAFDNLKNAVKDFFGSLLPDFIKDGRLTAFLTNVAGAIRALGKAVSEHLSPIQKNLLALGAVVAVLIGGPASVSALASALGLSGLAGSIAGLGSVLTPVGIIIGAFGAAWITNFGGIREATAQWLPQIVEAVQNLLANLRAWWMLLKTEILDPIMPGLNALFGALWNGLMRVITDVLKALGDWTGLLVALFTGDWKAAWENLKKLAFDVLDLLLPGFREKFAAIVSYLRNDLWNDIKAAWQRLVDSAKQWGSNLIQGFVDGIKSTIAAVKGAVSDAVQAVKDFMGFHSPAKEGPGADADEWMPNLIGMWADQLRAGKAQIAEAVAQIAGGLNIAPQLNALAAVGGGGGVVHNWNFSGATFRNREDIDYLRDIVEDVIEGKSRQVGRATGNWR